MKPHLSPTQIEMYCKCGEQYRRRYIEGEIIPPGIAALKGTCMHRAAQANFTQKVHTHADMARGAFREVAAAAFDEVAGGGYMLTAEEEARGQSAVLSEAKVAAVDLAEAHAIYQAPDYQPVLIEERVRIELPMCSHDLVGVLDLADDQRRVTDFKSSKRRKSQADADSSTQLSVYAAGHKALTGHDATELRLDTIVATKTKTSRDLVKTHRDERDLVALANRIDAVARGIGAGVFAPATVGAWWCGPHWCGYWRTCPYVNSERAAAAAESE